MPCISADTTRTALAVLMPGDAIDKYFSELSPRLIGGVAVIATMVYLPPMGTKVTKEATSRMSDKALSNASQAVRCRNIYRSIDSILKSRYDLPAGSAYFNAWTSIVPPGNLLEDA